MSYRRPLQVLDHYRIFPGLPPAGEPGTFIGWDADHSPHILVWAHHQTPHCWYAIGFLPDYAGRPLPTATRCIEDKADFIKAWAHSPMCPPIVSPEDDKIEIEKMCGL